MTYAGSAWQYVVLVSVCLINNSSEPWSHSRFGKDVRESQYIIGWGIVVFFMWVAVTLSSRDRPKHDPHTTMIQKAVSEAPPGGTVSMEWYKGVCKVVRRCKLTMALVVVGGTGVLLWAARPLSLW
eukprot:Hpha_TRINITY_DN15993_c0_g2::TRINITY_DN15993_c0_g2_i1::g.75163::m.75163